MTTAQDVDVDAAHPDDEAAEAGAAPVDTTGGTVVAPLSAERVDVRRRLMALRRW